MNMRELNKNEWVAVAVSLFVIGFVFLFGQEVMSIINPSSKSNMQQTSFQSKDEVVGTGEVVVPGSTVTVHYTGRLMDGKVFDSSLTRGEPFQFKQGAGQVIPGWDEGLLGMKVGGKRILIIPSDYGYGQEGVPGVIPGGATIVFEVELLKVTNN